jgi:hypothetical protein
MTQPAYEAIREIEPVQGNEYSTDTEEAWYVYKDNVSTRHVQGKAKLPNGTRVYLKDKSAYVVSNKSFIRATTPLYDNFSNIKDKMMANKSRVVGAILLVFALIFALIAATINDTEKVREGFIILASLSGLGAILAFLY